MTLRTTPVLYSRVTHSGLRFFRSGPKKVDIREFYFIHKNGREPVKVCVTQILLLSRFRSLSPVITITSFSRKRDVLSH